MLICEIETFHGAHSEFNAAVIATARAAFPDECVTFLASSKHGGAVRAELKSHGIDGVTILPLAEPPPNVRDPSRVFRVRTVRSIYRLCRELDHSRLLICGFRAAYQNYFSLLRPRWFRGQHRGLFHMGYYLTLKRSARARDALKRRVVRRLMAHRPTRVVALGPTVARHVVENLSWDGVDVAWIYHPYLYDDGGDAKPLDPDRLDFVFAGRTAKEKGFDVFCRIADVVSGSLAATSPEVTFSLVGGLRWVPEEYSRGPAVRIASTSERVPRDVFAAGLQDASYLVMPYDRGKYGKTKVSGVFFDAVKHLKPIIAFRTDDLAHYFERFGELGTLCDSADEMTNAIRHIAARPAVDEYADQQARLKRARDFFGIENQKKAFRALWD